MPTWARAALLRFVVCAVALGALSVMWGEQLVQAWLPLCRAEIEWLDDIYGIDRLELDKQGADRVIRMEVHQARYFVLGGRTVAPHPQGRANSSTLVANLLLPAVLLVASGLAWPARRVWGYALRLPALAVVWLALSTLDVPLVLFAGIWGLHVAAYEPGMFSPILIWVDMLQSGARLALPLVSGALVAWGLESLTKRRGRGAAVS